MSLHELPGNSGEPPLNAVSLGQVAGGIVGIKGQCRGQGVKGQCRGQGVKGQCRGQGVKGQCRGQGTVQRSRGQG